MSRSMCAPLPRSISELVRNKSDDKLSPHEAVLSAFSFFSRLNPEEFCAGSKKA